MPEDLTCEVLASISGAPTWWSELPVRWPGPR